MTSPLLAKAQRDGREIVNVTPERAGWTHVGFRALRLKAGDSEALDTGTRELCIVVLAGKIDMQAGVESLENLGTRTHVFDDRAPMRCTCRRISAWRCKQPATPKSRCAARRPTMLAPR
jgi:5-deoxy-glucuronate isomerase